MKIEVTHHCTAHDGKCVYVKDPYKCVSMMPNQESFTCPFLEVRRVPKVGGF